LRAGAEWVHTPRMKSAYELAMERLAASEPSTSAPLSDADKAELADIDARHKARLAEREIFLRQKLGEAEQAGSETDIEQIRKQIASERETIEEDREAAKERVRARARGR
jgi:hypothetical protein